MPRGGEAASFGLGALSAGAVLSAVAATWKFGEAMIALRHLTGVSEENAVFVRMVERVRLDLAEADRLMRLPEVEGALARSPRKVEWIRQSIVRCRAAMEEKQRFTESVRAGVEGGRTLGLRKRIWWVLEEKGQLETRRMEMAMCHLGLLQVIAFMAPFEPLGRADYRADERFYQEADEMIQRGDLPEATVIAEKKKFIRQRYDDFEYTQPEEEPPHSANFVEPQRQFVEECDTRRYIREYETADGNFVQEDTREFAPKREVVDDRDIRIFDEGSNEDQPHHHHHHHHDKRVHFRTTHRHGQEEYPRGENEDEDVVIKRTIIRKKTTGESSRL